MVVLTSVVQDCGELETTKPDTIEVVLAFVFADFTVAGARYVYAIITISIAGVAFDDDMIRSPYIDADGIILTCVVRDDAGVGLVEVDTVPAVVLACVV